MSNPSDINDLPPEILNEIFQVALEPYGLSNTFVYPRRQLFLKRICLVSHLWHDIACSIPEMWSLFQVAHPFTHASAASERCVRRQKLHLQRAKNGELDIVLDMRDQYLTSIHEHPSFWRAWEQLKEKADRWRSLLIHKPLLRSVDPLRHLLPPSLPKLVAFKSGVYIPVHWGLGPPLSSAPQLREFTATPPSANGVFPFTSSKSLLSLSITGMTWHFKAAFRNAAHLQTLQIDTYGHINPFQALEDLTLPCLKNLIWVGKTNHLKIFLTRLTAPNLETISLTQVPPGQAYPCRDDPTPLSFPSLGTIEYGTTRHIHYLYPLCELVGSLMERGSITVRMSVTTSAVPKDIRRGFFKIIRSNIRWLEERVDRVVWAGLADTRAEFFQSWDEAQNLFGASEPGQLICRPGEQQKVLRD